MKAKNLFQYAAACALVTLFAGAAYAGSIGLNFSVQGKDESTLAPADKAGVTDVQQSHWNNLPGPSGTLSAPTDEAGKELTPVMVAWDVPPGDSAWRSRLLMPWGFKENDLKLVIGGIQLGGSLEVVEVPYATYDVYVYVNAAENGGTGSVTLTTDKPSTQFYKLTWLNGKFTEAGGDTAEAAKAGNYVVFRNVNAKKFKIVWDGRVKGGWTGVSAVQIVGR